jgi:hypothetical protein
LFAILLTFSIAPQPSAATVKSFAKFFSLSRNSNLPNPCLSSARETMFPDAIRWTTDAFPTLAHFVQSNMSADANAITGVYVCRLLALRIVQQPENNPVYVSSDQGTATQFRLANRYGTLGLLAHNDQSGAQFFDLANGNEVDVVHGDGSIRRYVVSGIRHFRPIIADNPYSDFYDLDAPGDALSSSKVFQEIFANGDQVVFQTCITANGNPIWGRLFVIATPMSLN